MTWTLSQIEAAWNAVVVDHGDVHWESVRAWLETYAPQDSTHQGTAGAVDAPATMGPTAAGEFDPGCLEPEELDDLEQLAAIGVALAQNEIQAAADEVEGAVPPDARAELMGGSDMLVSTLAKWLGVFGFEVRFSRARRATDSTAAGPAEDATGVRPGAPEADPAYATGPMAPAAVGNTGEADEDAALEAFDREGKRDEVAEKLLDDAAELLSGSVGSGWAAARDEWIAKAAARKAVGAAPAVPRYAPEGEAGIP